MTHGLLTTQHTAQGAWTVVVRAPRAQYGATWDGQWYGMFLTWGCLNKVP